MKYIKQYEEINKKPEVGDYVILDDDTGEYNNEFISYSQFINNNVGRILEIKIKEYDMINVEISYDIEYENIPDKLKNLFAKKTVNDRLIYYEMSRPKSDIINIFKNKIDAELFLSTKKYNL